jgi:hypothetical protein
MRHRTPEGIDEQDANCNSSPSLYQKVLIMRFLNDGARTLVSLSAALVAAAMLSSCGGGDPYTGLWEGTLDGNRPVKAMMLGDGTYFLKYAGAPGSPGGLVRGTGEFRGGAFSSIGAVDFHFAFPLQRPTAARLSGKLGGHQTVTGTMNTKPLTVTYVKPFDPVGQLAELAGSYPGEVTFSLGLRATTFEVTADGVLTTVLNGCSITGQVVPRRDDAFDLTIQFGGAPCVFPGAAFQGAALYSTELKQLEAAVVNTTFGQAITFTARKP